MIATNVQEQCASM